MILLNLSLENLYKNLNNNNHVQYRIWSLEEILTIRLFDKIIIEQFILGYINFPQ